MFVHMITQAERQEREREVANFVSFFFTVLLLSFWIGKLKHNRKRNFLSVRLASQRPVCTGLHNGNVTVTRRLTVQPTVRPTD